jgi:catechol 2,3-dioxygenase-like lactoylglutathione lyase family enzyme
MSAQGNIGKGICRLHHIGIFTVHPKRMLNFYLTKLGFKEENRSILPKALGLVLFKVSSDCIMARLTRGNVCVEVFWAKAKMQKAPARCAIGYNHIGIEISARDAFCRRLKNSYRIGIIKIKRRDHYAYFIRDPDRNLIEIREPPRTSEISLRL